MRNFGYLVRRFFAFGGDWYISSVLINLLANGFSHLIPGDNGIYYGLILSSLIISYVYFVYLPLRFFNGSTFIMRFMVLKVVDSNEQLPSNKQMVIRYFVGCLILEGAFYIPSVNIRSCLIIAVLPFSAPIVKYIDICFMVLSLGSMVLAATDYKSGLFRTLHDRVSHTKVVDSIKVPNSKEKVSKKLTK